LTLTHQEVEHTSYAYYQKQSMAILNKSDTSTDNSNDNNKILSHSKKDMTYHNLQGQKKNDGVFFEPRILSNNVN